MKTVVVIPAYNEEKTIGKVIQGVKNYINNIIVVDDGSKDGTYKAVKNLNVIVLRHDVNLGKGAALKTGCDAALKLGADAIVVMDADGQHKAEDVCKFIVKIQNGADIVFGCRQIKDNKEMPFMMLVGNKFLSKLTNLLFGVYVDDTQSGFRAFTEDAYKKIRWDSSDYAMETEMIVRAGKEKLKSVQVPIQTIYNDAYKGTTILDGLKIFFNILRWKIL